MNFSTQRLATLFLLLIGLAACRFAPLPPTLPPGTAIGQDTTTLAPQITLAPTHTATPAPTATLRPSPTPSPTDLHLPAEQIAVFPHPVLYAGDRVSFSVPVDFGEAGPLRDVRVRLYQGEVKDPNAPHLAETQVFRYGILGEFQAVFYFIWTAEPGSHTFTFWVDPENEIITGDDDPDNNRATLTLDILPAAALPEPERDAVWLTARSACCLIYYTTDSAAERDIIEIIEIADNMALEAQQAMGISGAPVITLNLINKVVGHGGFANPDYISISYLDRHYAGSNLDIVLKHEFVHVYDLLFGRYRPSLVTEGLAVAIAGGHYKSELIQPRMRAAFELGWDFPMGELADNFYASQHELGYLQAASFMDYLIQLHGLDGLRRLYTNFSRDVAFSRGQQVALNEALQTTFGRSLAEFELDWRTAMLELPVDPQAVADLQTTVALYDTVREYQQQFVPGAYFGTAWLPDIVLMQQLQIVADYTRGVNDFTAVSIELLLVAADAALNQGDFTAAQQYIDAANSTLGGDLLLGDPLAASDLAAQYAEITFAALRDGYQPQSVVFGDNGEIATVTAIQFWPQLETYTYVPSEAGWQLQN